MPTFHHSNAEVRISMPEFVAPGEQLLAIGGLPMPVAPRVHLWMNYPGQSTCFEMKGRFINENQEVIRVTAIGKSWQQVIDLFHAWQEAIKTQEQQADIMADWLEEQGEKKAADLLRSNFT